MPEQHGEPWLRGPIAGVPAMAVPTVHALMQVREDVWKFTEGLTDAQMWERPLGLAPLGFHLRHMAGSLDRLTTYLLGGSLDEKQLRFLRSESESGAGREELVTGVYEAIESTSRVLAAWDEGRFREARAVGRKQIPATALGLVVHIAEHTQRHMGECIVVCQLLKAGH